MSLSRRRFAGRGGGGYWCHITSVGGGFDAWYATTGSIDKEPVAGLTFTGLTDTGSSNTQIRFSTNPTTLLTGLRLYFNGRPYDLGSWTNDGAFGYYYTISSGPNPTASGVYLVEFRP